MQFYWSNHQETGLVDIVAALFSLLAMVVLLKVWRPRALLRFPGETAPVVQRHGWLAVLKGWSPFLLASAFILCFLTSFDEFVIAFFLAGTKSTLPLYIWGQLRFPQKLPEILALGSCVLVGSLILVMLGEVLRLKRATSQ